MPPRFNLCILPIRIGSPVRNLDDITDSQTSSLIDVITYGITGDVPHLFLIIV